jgi:hypothetical protein
MLEEELPTAAANHRMGASGAGAPDRATARGITPSLNHALATAAPTGADPVVDILASHLSLGCAPIDGGMGGFVHHCACGWSSELGLEHLDTEGGPVGIVDTLVRRFAAHQAELVRDRIRP